MEIRELEKKDILEGLEKYHALYKKLQIRHRLMTVLFAVGLVFLYLYLRLFNTGVFVYDEERGFIEIRYSTAWVVTCPGDVFPLEHESEDKIVYLRDYRKYPYMKVLNVEEGITNIDADFFGFRDGIEESHLLKLQVLRLPSTLQYIGSHSFENCTSLKTVLWDEAAENAVIGLCAFSNTGIEEICIPEGVTEIEYGAFSQNDNLVKAVLPDSLKNIGPGIFKNCMNLEEVTWAAFLTNIPYQTFLGCKNLVTLKNTDAIRSITYNALTGTQITSEQLPDHVYCYLKDDYEDILNIEKNPWLKGYSYIYDAQKEAEDLAQLYDIPIETFQIEPNSGNYWLNGKYYNLDMSLEEFMANDEWEIEDTYSKDDLTCSYYLTTMDGKCMVTLVLDEKNHIIEYRFNGDLCQAVLPDGVNNFGMLPERISYLYGKQAVSEYTLGYHDAAVQVKYNRYSLNHCTINVLLGNPSDE